MLEVFMFRPQPMVWLLLVGAAPGSDCRVVSGPDGVCAAVRLDPGQADLHVGTTMRVRVNGLDCAGGLTCVDCADRRHRVRWRSSAPGVAIVDSTGLSRAGDTGAADIRLESADGLTAGMRVIVSPWHAGQKRSGRRGGVHHPHSERVQSGGECALLCGGTRFPGGLACGRVVEHGVRLAGWQRHHAV